MVKMSRKSREFLRKHFKNAEELLHSDDSNDSLIAIYDLIMEEGFEDDFEGYKDFGRQAQTIYDDIYTANV